MDMETADIVLTGTDSPYGRIEVMRAQMINTRFAKHFHEGFGVGVITSGTLSFNYRGERLIAGKGLVNTVNPDEPHDGCPAEGSGWTYRMLYFAESVFSNAFHDISAQNRTPYITNGVIEDGSLASEILRYTEITADPESSALEKDSAACTLMASVIAHTDKKPQGVKTCRLGSRLRTVKDFINDRITENITGRELADTAGLSLFHFIRSFKADTGLTPHEYASVRRAIYARKLLENGLTPAEAASEAGYADQSHMTKRFRRFFGTTPKTFQQLRTIAY
ncbi:AraC family transcriptional regulator [Geovibrio thiophilus]|uniref:AraC family transcriptional regulator n=1 Tax=Geovibrio thiophilus TaxID=139438 RepID=A0A410JVC0_9BACT|nr:AraC family transcriptional regulator [Geovibrio thiophilus]QAR32122.1 AraC family transcriptional regulator [Geovibrio thiophilus]